MDGRVWPHAVVPPCVSCCMISEQLWLVRWFALTQNGQESREGGQQRGRLRETAGPGVCEQASMVCLSVSMGWRAACQCVPMCSE